MMTDEDRVRLHHMLDASKKATALVSGISLTRNTLLRRTLCCVPPRSGSWRSLARRPTMSQTS